MFDRSIALCKIVASSIATTTRAVLLNLVGPGGSLEDLAHPEAEEEGETAAQQPEFGALGLIGRPPPPSKVDGRQAYAEAFALRTGNALVPVAYRDLRLNSFFPAPKLGTNAWVGWAGAFDSNEAALNPDGSPKSSLRTIYVPYSFVGTTPSKAHAVTIDGTAGNESIAIVHGDGMAVLVSHGAVVIKNAAGDAYVEVNATQVVINGNTVINGGATIGSPTGAKPAAVATPLLAYLDGLEQAIGAGMTAIGAGAAAAGANGKLAFDTAVGGLATVKATIAALKTSIT
jgi:hypothetical protein